MSRIEQKPRAPDSTPDAWKRHENFHKELDATQVQDALVTIKPYLHHIFVGNALFCEETGTPTVPLNFLVEILEQSGLLPVLPSHNFKLGLQLAISQDLSSPLRNSPSKRYSEQRIQFDTFVNAFAFSVFSYPSQLPHVDDSTSSEAQENAQDANPFAKSLKTAAKHLSEFVRSSSKAGASDNTNTTSLTEISNDPSAVSSPKPSDSLVEQIDELNDLHSTRETILEQDPRSPIIQDEECSLHDSSTVQDDNNENESIGTFDTECSAPPTPSQFFTPRADLAVPTPLRRFASTSFASSPKKNAWFTPRQGIVGGFSTTPSNGVKRLLLSGESKKEMPFKDSPRSREPDESQFEDNSQRDEEHSPVQSVRKSESEVSYDVSHSKQASEAEVETVHNVQDTTSAASSTDSSQERLVPSPDREISVENVQEPSSTTGNETSESSTPKSGESVHPQSEELSSQRIPNSSNLESPSAPSPSSLFQSPEIRDTFTALEHNFNDDPTSSRKLSFSDSEDGKSSDSSQYDNEEERSITAMKLSQASDYGQQIEEPEFANELDGLAVNALDKSDVHGEEDPIASDIVVEEANEHSPRNSFIEDNSYLKTGLLSERSESMHTIPRAASMAAILKDEGLLFEDYSNPSQFQLGQSEFEFESLNEDELLFDNGNQSDSSDLSMRTREAYTRMLDSFIENGNFGRKIDSISCVKEQGISQQGDINSEIENAAADRDGENSVHSGDKYLIVEDSPSETQHDRSPEGVCSMSSQSKRNEHESQLMSEAEESGKRSDGASKISVMVERSISYSSVPTPAMKCDTHEDVKGEEIALNMQCSHEDKTRNECMPKRNASYASPAPFKNREILTSDLTPEDFNVVRKQIDNLPSLEMLVESSLGSVCTKTSLEADRSSGGKRSAKERSAKERSDLQERAPSSVRDVSKAAAPGEHQIVVQCSGHVVNNDAVAAALRESSEVCRLLQKELFDRRTTHIRSGRFQSVIEWLFLILVVVFVTLVVVERRMDRFTFSEVRV